MEGTLNKSGKRAGTYVWKKHAYTISNSTESTWGSQSHIVGPRFSRGLVVFELPSNKLERTLDRTDATSVQRTHMQIWRSPKTHTLDNTHRMKKRSCVPARVCFKRRREASIKDEEDFLLTTSELINSSLLKRFRKPQKRHSQQSLAPAAPWCETLRAGRKKLLRYQTDC